MKAGRQDAQLNKERYYQKGGPHKNVEKGVWQLTV
jgi:hypothetical protein